MSIAATGLQNTATRFQKDATTIVQSTTTGSDDNGQLESAVVSSLSDTTSYKANASVFKTADRMMGALLDVTS